MTGFASGITLLDHLRTKGTFDVYLLDVIMPGENGIELGLEIRELDQGGRIVYLTASPDFAVDSYQAKASDYLLKPLERDRLFRTLDRLVLDLERERRSYATIKTRDGFRRISLRSIVYGELAGRCVHYHLADGSVVAGMSLRGSFREAVSPLLAHRRFALCAASFLVNLSFVERVDSLSLRLEGGRVLPISRAFRGQLTGRWLDYHLEGGRGA